MDNMFFVEFLKLTQAIKNNDKDTIETQLIIINEMETCEEIQRNIKEYLRNSHESNELLLYVVENCVHVIDKGFLREYTELKSTKILSKQEIISYLEKDPGAENEFDKYLYYNAIVKKISEYGDCELVDKAIAKLQSL